MSIDPKFVELTADVLEIVLYNMICTDSSTLEELNRPGILFYGDNSAFHTVGWPNV